MRFKTATDELLKAVTLEDVAKALGASVQAVRQARAAEGSTSHRSPPPDWEKAVARLAARRGAALIRLARRLEKGGMTR